MSTQFEQHARDEFEKHQVPVDVESLWENVHPRVKEEKKDRKFLWFFLSGFVIAGALFTAIYFLQKEDTGSNVKTTTEQIIEDATTNSALATSEGKSNGPSDSKSNTTDNKSLASENSSSVLGSEPITDDSSKEKTTTANDRSTSANSNSTLKENKQSANTVPSTAANLSSPSRQTNDTAIPLENNSITTVKSSSDSKPSAAELNVAPSSTLTPEVIAPSTATKINSPNNNSTNTVSTKNEKSDLQLQSLATDPFANNFLASLTLPKMVKVLQEKKDGKGGSAKPSLLKKFFKDTRIGIGVYGGYSGTTFGLSANGDAEEYIRDRKASEQQLETIHLGLNVLIQHKQGFYLRTGAEYTRIASLFEYKTENTFISDSIPGIVEFRINNLTSDTVEVQGILAETTIESYQKKTYNYFHIVDIPIILGYNFAYANWRFGLEAGVYTNVYLKRKGDIFNLDNEFYDLATDEDKWYKTNIGITPYVGFNAAYSINDNFQIHASPGFRFKKVFTTSDASPAKEERASLGMQLGVRYFF